MLLVGLAGAVVGPPSRPVTCLNLFAQDAKVSINAKHQTLSVLVRWTRLDTATARIAEYNVAILNLWLIVLSVSLAHCFCYCCFGFSNSVKRCDFKPQNPQRCVCRPNQLSPSRRRNSVNGERRSG